MMNDSRWMASSIGTDLGNLAVFTGFEREELQGVADNWRLELAPALETGADCYQIVREPWSEEAQRVYDSARAKRAAKQANAGAQPDGLIHQQCGHEDALVGSGGIVWIAPGRRIARVALTPDCEGPFDFEELIGAALTHTLALVGCLPLHGMAAEIDGIGVLALGDSMAGKSTLALAILHAGGRIVSDDFLLARFKADQLVLSTLRQDLYVREGSYELIPTDLRSLFSSSGAGPGRMKLCRTLAPEAFLDELSPQVVWFLDGTRRPSKLRISKVSQAEALSLLLRAGSPMFISKRYGTERVGLNPWLVHVVQLFQFFKIRPGSDLLCSPTHIMRKLLNPIVNR
ncbi:MAG: hypothetical protein IPP78_00130 [Holophagaceae bacterium]|nr:hypothetical protein [Holophagaceae bacterium]